MIIVYSSGLLRNLNAPAGTRFVNPGFFVQCEPGAEAVYLNGDYPRIKSAYERAGVPVFDLRQRKIIATPLPAPERTAKPKPTRRRKKATS